MDRGCPRSWTATTRLSEVAPEVGLGALVTSAPSPLLVLRRDDLGHNLATMQAWVRSAGVSLLPHGKTSMCPSLWDAQLAAGGAGLTVATPAQLRVARGHGIDRLLLANELVDATTARWLVAELAADPGFGVCCYVDSLDGVSLLSAALADSVGPPLPVLVELGVAGGRTGCREPAGCLAIVDAVLASPVLALAGVAGYEGPIGPPGAGPDTVQAVRSWLAVLRELAIQVRARLLSVGALPADRSGSGGRFVVSAGGSVFFDLVAEVLTPAWPAAAVSGDVEVVIRSGCYVTHDHGHYSHLSPFSRRPELGPALRPALALWTTVLSRPEPGLALLDAGRRDAPSDKGLPVPLRAVRDGQPLPLGAATISAMDDQHAYLRLESTAPLRPGDRVELGISHPCTAFDRWRTVVVVDADDRVLQTWPTYF